MWRDGIHIAFIFASLGCVQGSRIQGNHKVRLVKKTWLAVTTTTTTTTTTTRTTTFANAKSFKLVNHQRKSQSCNDFAYFWTWQLGRDFLEDSRINQIGFFSHPKKHRFPWNSYLHASRSLKNMFYSCFLIGSVQLFKGVPNRQLSEPSCLSSGGGINVNLDATRCGDWGNGKPAPW